MNWNRPEDICSSRAEKLQAYTFLAQVVRVQNMQNTYGTACFRLYVIPKIASNFVPRIRLYRLSISVLKMR